MKIWRASLNVSPGNGRWKRSQDLAGTLMALILFSATVLGFSAQDADAGSNSQTTQTAQTAGLNSSASAGSKLPGITVEGAEQREALRLKANDFVSSVLVQSSGHSLYRWTARICPRVEGLPENVGEFILERISKAATDANAPLAGRKCRRPNLYVIASDEPDQTLSDWRARDQDMFNAESGGNESLDDFLHSDLPVRVWYNTYQGCSAGAMTSPGATMLIGGMSMGGGTSGGCATYGGTRMSRGTAADIAQAIVVVDLGQMKNVTNRQIADYIALVSLADVRLDSDPTPVPSILELFAQGTPPQGLTPWDRALLYSLYNTDHMSTSEVQEIEITMVKRIAQ